MTRNPQISIVAIGGSVRPGNFTMKALKVVTDHLSTIEGVQVTVVDPAEIDWPLPGRTGGGARLAQVQEQVEEATGVILATPEYHGSVSSVLKLALENLGFPSRLAGKPIALLGVAAGAIGAIQSLGQLRMIASHIGAIVLPGAVSVAGVQGIFDEAGNCKDAGTEQRLCALGDGLVEYIQSAVLPKLELERLAREA